MKRKRGRWARTSSEGALTEDGSNRATKIEKTAHPSQRPNPCWSQIQHRLLFLRLGRPLDEPIEQAELVHLLCASVNISDIHANDCGALARLYAIRSKDELGQPVDKDAVTVLEIYRLYYHPSVSRTATSSEGLTAFGRTADVKFTRIKSMRL